MRSKHPDEKISVLMDGELESPERDRLIQELKTDSRVRCCLERYQLISDTLRKHLPDTLDHNLFQRVTQAIANEEPHRQIPRNTTDTTHFTWRVTGFALAASLAALAVIGIQWTQPEQSLVSPQLASTFNTGTVVAGAATTQQIPANRRSDIQLVAEGNMLSPVNRPPFGSVNKDTQWRTDQPAVRSRLTEYLINHNEYASAISVREGLLPQVRVVGYDSGE